MGSHAMDLLRYTVVDDESSTSAQTSTSAPTTTTLGGEGHADAFKAVLLSVLLVVPLIASVFPFSLRACVDRASPERRRQRYAGLFTLLSCFGGGVFLATCLLDLFPDAMKQMSHFAANHSDKDTPSVVSPTVGGAAAGYPLCELLVATGFFLVTFMDQIMLILRDRGIIGGHGHSHGNFGQAGGEENAAHTPETDTSDADEGGAQQAHGESDRRVLFSPSTSDPAAEGAVRQSPDGRRQSEETEPPTPRLPRRHLAVHVTAESGGGHSGNDADSVPADPVVEEEEEHGRTEHAESGDTMRYRSQSAVSRQSAVSNKRPHVDPASHSAVRSILLVAALSLHSVFEGLALGVDPKTADAANVFTAVMVHKTLIAFSLGVSLVQSKMRAVTIVLSCITFSVMAPLGGFAGMLIMHTVDGESQKRVGGALTSVACGTFLYVTCMEILPHELNAPGRRPAKMLALIAGFAVIAIMLWVEPA